MKAQSLVFQFLLFFTIGFLVFLLVGNTFKTQLETFRERIVRNSLRVSGDYIAASIIYMFESCKECDEVRMSINIPNKTAGYPMLFNFNNNIRVEVPTGEKYETSINNLNYSLTILGSGVSTREIVLTYNKNNNKIEVS